MITALTYFKKKIRLGVLKLLKPGIIDYHGIKLSLQSNELSPYIRKMVYSGAYESKEASLIGQTLEKSDRVLELGSGMGFIACFCARFLGDSAKVHAVEALPHMESVIRKNFELNGVCPELTMAAVGREAGEVAFSVAANFWSSSVSGAGQGESKIRVPMIALSELLDSFNPSYLVVDVEGAEEQLFDMDMGTVCKICLEVHPHYIGDDGVNRAVDALFKQGFVIDYRKMSKGMLYLYR